MSYMTSVAALPLSYLDLPVFGFVDHAHLPTGFPFTIHKQPASGSDFITKSPVYHPSHIKKLLMWRSAGDGSIVKSKKSTTSHASENFLHDDPKACGLRQTKHILLDSPQRV